MIFNNPRAHCPHSCILFSAIFQHYQHPIGDFWTYLSEAQIMRLFIAAVIAVIISGCAGTGFTDLSTLQKGPNGKTWTQDTFESKGSE